MVAAYAQERSSTELSRRQDLLELLGKGDFQGGLGLVGFYALILGQAQGLVGFCDLILRVFFPCRAELDHSVLQAGNGC